MYKFVVYEGFQCWAVCFGAMEVECFRNKTEADTCALHLNQVLATHRSAKMVRG